jgi:crotonobetainyl-CoA:carnitine CoA-transferase CaiB-like acyl-CoA transferase
MVRYPAPLLGEHTRQALTEELGMGAKDISALAQAGALQ